MAQRLLVLSRLIGSWLALRARLVGLEDRLVDYRWNSYPFYVRAVKRLVEYAEAVPLERTVAWLKKNW